MVSVLKLKIAISVYLVLLISVPIFSQNFDSLKMVVFDQRSSHNAKAKTANELATWYQDNNVDSTLKYIAIASENSILANNKREEIYAQVILGAINTTNWTIDSTEKHFNGLLKNKIVNRNLDIQAAIETNLGRLYNFHGKFQKAITHSLNALEINEKLDKKHEVAKLRYNLGVIYYSNSQYELAIEKFREALQDYQALKNQTYEAFCLNGIANAYINTSQLDSALYYSNKVKKLGDETENIVLQAISRTTIGSLFGEQEKYQESKDIYLEAIPYLEKYGNQLLLANCYCTIAAADHKLGNAKEAKLYIDKAYQFDILKDNVRADELCLKTRALIYEQNGLYEQATGYFQDYIEYQDSILLKENKLVISELEEKYESSKKEAEIERQNLQIERAKNQRNLLFTALGLSVLLGGSIIWGIYSRLNRNKKINMQEQNLKDQKIRALENEKQILSLSSMLEGQEAERIRIAKDLHDGLGGLLTNVKAHMSRIQSEIKKVQELDIYNSANAMIDKAHDEVRRISQNLMPADLRLGGLPLAIKQLVHEFKYTQDINTQLELLGFDDERLHEKTELFVYRIIQELLTNISKYADAKKVLVQLSKFDQELQVLVEDDGKGFELKKAMQGKGIGLKSIHSRVEQLGGTIDIDSRPTQGSTFTINIPTN